MDIREFEKKIRKDKLLQLRVMASMGKDWERFDELLVKLTRNELSGSEFNELYALIEKLKANNLDDPDIKAIETYRQ